MFEIHQEATVSDQRCSTFGEVQQDVRGAVGLLQVMEDGWGAGRGPGVSVALDH